jgi:hypothetical protein
MAMKTFASSSYQPNDLTKHRSYYFPHKLLISWKGKRSNGSEKEKSRVEYRKVSHLWMGEFGYSLQFPAVINGARFVCTFPYLFDRPMLYFTVFGYGFLQIYGPGSTGAKTFVSCPQFFLPHFPLARSRTRHVIHMLDIFAIECCLQL